MTRYLMVDFWKDWWAAWQKMRRIEAEIDRIKDSLGVEDRDFEAGRPVYGLSIEWQSPDWWGRIMGK